MVQRWKFLTVLLVSMVLSGCARTQVTGVWQKESYAGPPLGSVLVFAQPGQKQERTLWESIISERFQRSGMNTVEAARIVPVNTTVNLLTVLDHAKEKGIEGVLVTRDKGRRTVTSYNPPEVGIHVSPYWYPYGPIPYFSPWYPAIFPYVYYEYSPGYTSQHHFVIVEIFLYLPQTGEQVWNMTIQSVDPLSTTALINDVSDRIVKGLRKANLIRLTR